MVVGSRSQATDPNRWPTDAFLDFRRNGNTVTILFGSVGDSGRRGKPSLSGFPLSHEARRVREGGFSAQRRHRVGTAHTQRARSAQCKFALP